ncbi:hypothetical protein ISN44_As01g006550 [Arabidopsis suecica]|uniref:DUF674 family protein n=1 Tax=Arabidopsis suecica TaxID=45249 RepID=A0A8T2H016_ARASU|nr:hypothetical protein ISN44_As01g006550 [Arabidopsis suecica]
MAGTAEKPILKLTLCVDPEKNKVVFADVGKDFVDVLFGFLALPMGTIVRLLEKHKQNQPPIGCFNNLYKSVVDMDKDDFITEASKGMLLYPRHVKEKQCRRLKLNIDDDMCNLMTEEFKVPEGGCDELFVTPKSAFIITENMDEVKHASIILAWRTLLRLGYNDLSMLKYMSVDVNHEEVISLLHCLFSSETPFTDVFLKKQISCGMTRLHDMPTLPVQDGGEAEAGSDGVLSLTVFVRKPDMKVLYAEGGQDFVDLLFIFLAIPLESVLEITGGNVELGCIGNFWRNMKSLSSSGGTNSMLPQHYGFHKSLLGVGYERNKLDVDVDDVEAISLLSATNTKSDLVAEHTLPVSSGFVKRGSTFIISDDLIVTASNLSSTLGLLKKLDTDLNDIEEQVISITGAEAINLLKASLVTSTPLTTALGSLLLKNPKVESL